MICVSVIVPIYNGAATIERCMKSILNQSLADIEVIAVNDGSTDNTLEILGGIRDKRLKIMSQENSGQGAARNAAMAAARGEYLSFIDADDTVGEQMLENMYTAAKRHNADIAQCGLRNINPDGSEFIQKECAVDAVVTVGDRADYIDRYFTACVHSRGIANKIFRRDFIESHNIKFGNNKKFFAEDLVFNMETLKYLTTICFISKPYYNYYHTAVSHSHSHKNDLEKLLKMHELFKQEINGAPEGLKDSFEYTAAVVSVYNIGACEGSDKETARKILKSPELKDWIRAALKRNCGAKHRLLFTAMCVMPSGLQMKAAKYLYSR